MAAKELRKVLRFCGEKGVGADVIGGVQVVELTTEQLAKQPECLPVYPTAKWGRPLADPCVCDCHTIEKRYQLYKERKMPAHCMMCSL